MLQMRFVCRTFSGVGGLLPSNQALAQAAAFHNVRERPACKLTRELDRAVLAMLPYERHLAERVSFVRLLQRELAKILPGAKVSAFGSAVNGLWTPQSDVDICVQIQRVKSRNAQIQALRQLATALMRVCPHYLEPRFSAQVPILHWSPRLPGALACDICINNILAVENSQLMAHYVQLDSRVRTLGLCVKTWAARRGINDRSRGTISSFALLLMVISFLQRRTPPVLPSLQDMAISRRMPPVFVAGADVRYCKDAEEILKELAYLRDGKPPNEETSGDLLVEFFRLYANGFGHGTVQIRDTQRLQTESTATVFQVDNPFEVGKDVATVDPSQYDLIQREFMRALTILDQGKAFKEVLRGSEIDEAVLPPAVANRSRR